MIGKVAYNSNQALHVGFAAGPVEGIDLLNGLPDTPHHNAPALIAYAWLINLQQGGRLQIALAGPSGLLAVNSTAVFERAKAQYVIFAGRNRPDEGWSPGLYSVDVKLFRADTVVWQAHETHRVGH